MRRPLAVVAAEQGRALRELSRGLACDFTVRHVERLDALVALLQRQAPSIVVVEDSLSDIEEILALIAREHPLVPRVIWTNRTVATAAAPGTTIHHVGRPFSDLRPILDRAHGLPIADDKLARFVVNAARAVHVSPTELRLLCWVVAGRSVKDFAVERGVAMPTVRRTLRDLRGRFPGRPVLQDLVISLLHRALASRESGALGGPARSRESSFADVVPVLEKSELIAGADVMRATFTIMWSAR
jgi:hypothetical protein